MNSLDFNPIGARFRNGQMRDGDVLRTTDNDNILGLATSPTPAHQHHLCRVFRCALKRQVLLTLNPQG
ncbi:MAG: hypothetical protein H8D67_11890 [Deltaproteobacteria bacterium]|nr:hypothetical protein [Deltaproteobacteria bacterium]